MIGPGLEADVVEQLHRPGGALGRTNAGLRQGEFDVFAGGEHRHQVEPLKNEPDPAKAEVGQFSVGEPLDGRPHQFEVAGRREIKAAEQLQQGRLARAGRAGDGEILSGAERQ